ncbi:unnamed protein product, partial [marine sediment metagenome]
VGYTSAYSKECPKFRIGSDIRVNAMYEHVDSRNRLRGKLVNVRKELRAVADSLEPMDTLLPPRVPMEP